MVGAVMLVAAAVLIRPRGRVWTGARPFALEISLILVLYALWRIAGQLSVLHTDGAEARGRDLWNLERTLHLPSELTIQHWVLPHPWLVQAANVYYAVVHVPALIAMLHLAVRPPPRSLPGRAQHAGPAHRRLPAGAAGPGRCRPDS